MRLWRHARLRWRLGPRLLAPRRRRLAPCRSTGTRARPPHSLSANQRRAPPVHRPAHACGCQHRVKITTSGTWRPASGPHHLQMQQESAQYRRSRRLPHCQAAKVTETEGRAFCLLSRPPLSPAAGTHRDIASSCRLREIARTRDRAWRPEPSPSTRRLRPRFRPVSVGHPNERRPFPASLRRKGIARPGWQRFKPLIVQHRCNQLLTPAYISRVQIDFGSHAPFPVRGPPKIRRLLPQP